MAKKRPGYAAPKGAGAPPAAVAQEPRALDWLAPLGLGVLYFVLTALSAIDTIRALALFAAGAALVACAARRRVFLARFKAPAFALMLYVLMGGISTFYAISGKFGLTEFLKIYSSFCLGSALLALAPGEGEKPAKWLATVVSTALAVWSLVSVDYISTRWISTPVLGFLGLFSTGYEALAGVEAGVRMTSAMENPNVFAGAAGLGVLLSLSLSKMNFEKEEKKVYFEKNIHLILLYINAFAFVLAFSMGASGSIAVGFLVMLLLEKKEKRGGLFILMVETLVLVLIPAMIVSRTSFGVWNGFDAVPTACLVVGSAALVLVDRFVGERVANALAGKTKLLFGMIGGALALLIVFGAVAVIWTGPAALSAGESLRRAAYPEADTYSLAIETDGGLNALNVTIESQNDVETMMHTSTVLYSGDAGAAVFTVPEDSKVVYFNFSAARDVEFKSAAIVDEDGNSESLPLEYKLLPGFIANRLQGLFANENAIQRLVFFEDGMKLFARSPIYGLGMGAYENGIKNVQSFYYETKYAHNHYIQALAELGVIGLVLFVGILATAAVCILKTFRKENAHPLVPALGAAVAFMAIHAATEVVFSYYSYLPMAFAVFMLISLCCGDALRFTLPKKVKTGVVSGFALLVFVFAVLVGCNMSARNLVDSKPTFDSLEQAIELDKFEWADWLLSYVKSVLSNEVDAKTEAKAEEYADRLAQVNSNTIPLHLAEYRFARGEDDEAFEMLRKYCDYVSSDSSAWSSAFEMAEFYDDGSDRFESEVEGLVEQMETWVEGNLGDIALSEKAALYVEKVRG